MNKFGGYPRFLAIAYVISAAHTPLFFRFGWVATLIMFLLSGIVFGTTFFFLGLISSRIRLRSFFVQLFVQTVLVCLNIAVSISIVGVVGAAVLSGTSLFDAVLYRNLLGMIEPNFAVGAILLGLLFAFGVNSIGAISRKLGPGVLWNWMTGKYYSPREEELIVMFLDMKDSTTIAESLGTLRFSSLVRDFFADLTGPLQKTGARVSHYIGDEAVIYWFPKVALKKAACLELVPLFEGVLTLRSNHYVEKYGFVPEFKAGAHIGPVVATEVGEVKSEVVFHGDTLNTAARIQGLCGEEGHGFLVSGELANRLESTGYALTFLGNRLVKGRVKEIELYAVRPI